MSRDYQYACERAELFGHPIPTQEEWKQSEEYKTAEEETEINENIATEDLAQAEESSKRIGGGLDELNSILSSTQRKINRFKTVCGSLGTMLKIRRTSQPSTPKSTPKHVIQEDNTNNSAADNEDEISVNQSGVVTDTEQSASTLNKKIDLNEKMSSHLDKLDSLVTKAENAQYSMAHQTKQMKRILK